MVSALRYNCICILKHSSKRFKKYTCIVNLGFPGPTSNELISYLKSVNLIWLLMDLYFSPYATSSNQNGNNVSSNCLHRTPEYLKGVWGFTLTDHDISIVYNYPKYALERANAPCEQKIFGHIAPPPQFCKVIHIHNQRPFFRQDFLYRLNLAAPTFNLLPTALMVLCI